MPVPDSTGSEKEQIAEQFDGASVLAMGGGKEGKIDSQSLSTVKRAAAEGDFPKDDRQAEGLFGVIIGRRHALGLQEGEQIVVPEPWPT